jgi:microsomal epoxide hydrolase
LSKDFHVVVPSIPGYGFSGPTREKGWNVERVVRAWAQLMNRLGYSRYGAHGSDWARPSPVNSADSTPSMSWAST